VFTRIFSSMKVSIVTVVYNNVGTIASALESVRSQDYPNIEYIVIDGKSTDGTLDILKEHEDEIDILVSEEDKGIYDAMNKGVERATGEVVALLNSDDIYWDEHVISDVVKAFQDHPEAEIVYGNIAYVRGGEEQKVVRHWKSRPYYERFFEEGHVPPHTGFYVKQKCYREGGLFKPELRLAADYDLMFRFMRVRSFKPIYIDRNMVRMRLGGATNQSFANILNGNKEIVQAWKSYGIRPPVFFLFRKLWHRLTQFSAAKDQNAAA